jgi:hypothetical protein
MTDKISRYRKLLQSLAALGDEQAKKITSNRYKLIYHYFVRCVSLTSAIILLVEAENLTGAFALEKSLVDALLNGLYFGYVAPDKEMESTIAMALKGRGTGHSNMRKRACMIDAEFSQRRTFMTGMYKDAVRQSSELLNEFGHGGLLSTVLAMKHQPEFADRVLSVSAISVIAFLGNVFVLENLDLTPLQTALKEFQSINQRLGS